MKEEELESATQSDRVHLSVSIELLLVLSHSPPRSHAVFLKLHHLHASYAPSLIKHQQEEQE